MKAIPGIKVLGGLIIIFGLLFSDVSYAQVKKVRVIVKNSSIRVEPNVQSKIISSPPLGAVFEVIDRTGGWYKVKLNSEQYGLGEGYLNQMFTEELQETEKPKKEEEEKPVTREKEEKREESQVEKEPEKPEVAASNLEQEEDKIRSLIAEYAQALEGNSLLSFYKMNSTSEFYPEVKEDAEWMTRTYDRVNICISDIYVLFRDEKSADVSISLIITGLPRVGGSRKLLFEGWYDWSMIKQASGWKIKGVASRPYE